MLLSRLSTILIALLVLGETGLALWRNLPVQPSTAPVFSLPMMETAMKTPGKFQHSIEVYNADRGGELKLHGPDHTSLTVFYFEWDQIQMGPMMEATGHAPEECNIAAGYKFLGIGKNQSFHAPGQPPLRFDCTRFEDPAGQVVFMYRLGWIQGYGALELRQGLNRSKRLRDSFHRHVGAARVLEAGVFNAQDADHAWHTFREQVLEQIQW